MPRRQFRRAPRALALSLASSLVLAAGLSGCLKSETSASLLAQAKQSMQQGDSKAALIQLKNAASQSPEDAEVRYQLARLYNDNNEAAAAEKEIRKALSLNYARATALPQLVRALVGQGKAQAALDESADDAAQAPPELLAARADAWLALHDYGKAREGYLAAQAAKPGLAPALLGLARLAVLDKDLAAAAVLVEKAVSANPQDPFVHHFQGVLLRRQGKDEAALVALGKALTLRPSHQMARAERIDLELARRKFDAARADIAILEKDAPDSLYGTYLTALLAFYEGKYTDAQASILKVLKIAPGNMPSVLLAGANELKLGHATPAQGYLNSYLSEHPDDLYARKLLAQALLMSGQAADAAVALQPMLRAGSKDGQLLVLAGEAHLRNKDYKAAQTYFERAATVLPNEAALHTSLGLAQLGQGQYAKALEQLERATALDPKSAQAALYKIRTEFSLRRYEQALAAVKAYQASQKDDPAVRNLEGGIYLAQGKRAAARVAFTQAVALQPNYLVAIMNLAQLDLEDRQPQAARKRFEAVLQHDKKHIGAMTALASLEAQQGRPEAALHWLEQAVAEKPNSTDLGLQLARAYLQAKQYVKATTLARKLQVSDGNKPAVSELLGQVQLANNDASGALESFGKLVQQEPKSTTGWFGMATAHLMLKNVTAATEDLRKVLAIDPRHLAANLSLAEIAQQQGKGSEVQTIARALQKDPAPHQQVAGYVLEGDLLARQRKHKEAMALYEKAYALEKNGRIVLAIHRTLLAAGLPRDADQRLAQYRKEQPGDVAAAVYAAELSLSRKDYKAAIADLELVLKVAPDSPVALNNLAWAYSELKDPRAMETAEKALRAAPDSPAVLDTLGWLLVAKGDTGRAVPMLKRAATLQPSNAVLRYHLAVALNKAGDKKAAKAELEKLVTAGTPFPHLDDAIALLKVLNGS